MKHCNKQCLHVLERILRSVQLEVVEVAVVGDVTLRVAMKGNPFPILCVLLPHQLAARARTIGEGGSPGSVDIEDVAKRVWPWKSCGVRIASGSSASWILLMSSAVRSARLPFTTLVHTVAGKCEAGEQRGLW